MDETIAKDICRLCFVSQGASINHLRTTNHMAHLMVTTALHGGTNLVYNDAIPIFLKDNFNREYTFNFILLSEIVFFLK